MATRPSSFLNTPANIDEVANALADYTDEKVDEAAGIAHFLGLRKTANQSVSSNVPSGGYHKVTWPTVAFTGGTALAWDNVNNVVTNTSADTITVKVDCRIGWEPNSSGGRWVAIIKTVSSTPTIELADSAHNTSTSVTISALVQMPAGSTIHIGAAQNSGGSLNILGALTSSGGPPNALSVEVVAVG